jgi:AcrR family transcriptional regulator
MRFGDLVKDDKSTKILNAAIKIFADKGYQYATIAEIAKEAGISKGLIHFYFESKLDLILSVILSFLEHVNMINAKKLIDANSPVDSLKAVFETFQELLLKDEENLYWGKILNVGLPEVDKIKSEVLRNKKIAIDNQNRELFNTIDRLIIEGQKVSLLNENLKPEIIRQILGGSSQFLTTGMYLQLSGKGGLGYNKDDVKKAMNMLIDSFTVVK